MIGINQLRLTTAQTALRSTSSLDLMSAYNTNLAAEFYVSFNAPSPRSRRQLDAR